MSDIAQRETVAEATGPEAYAHLVAGCVRVVETECVPPLARALAASVRVATLSEAELARHGVLACWTDDVRAVVDSFARASTVVDVSREPQRLLRSLEASCNQLISDHSNLQPVHALWQRLDKLRDARPVFGLWHVRVQQALTAHDEASATAGDDRRRRFTEATADVKALIELHALVLEAHQAWADVVSRRTDGVAAHDSFAGWHAGLEKVTLPLVERLQAQSGPRAATPLAIADVGKAYRDLIEASQARVREFDQLKENLRKRRVDLEGRGAKLLPELAQLAQKLAEASRATARAASQRGSAGTFDTGRYGAWLIGGGTIGLVGGFVSCVSDLGRHGTVEHIVFGPLIGGLLGVVVVGLMHAFASSAHSANMSSRYQSTLAELHGAQAQAIGGRDRALGLRQEMAAAFITTAPVDGALASLQGAIDESLRLMS